MRQQRDGEHEHERHERERGTGPHEASWSARNDGLPRVDQRRTPEHHAAQEIEQQRRHQHHQHERVGDRVLHLAQQVEDLHRGHVVHLEHQRCAELREAPDQDQRGACEQARTCERQRDFEKGARAARPEIPCGTFERRIDVGERRLQVQEHHRVERKRLDRDHAVDAQRAQPIDARRAAFGEQRAERSEAPEHLPEADGTDERRQNQGQEQEARHQRAAGELEAHAEHRERQRDRRGEHGGRHGDDRRLHEAAAEHRIGEHEREVLERQLAAARDEAALHHAGDGQQQRNAEKHEQSQRNDGGARLAAERGERRVARRAGRGEGAAHGASFPSSARASASTAA